MTNNGDGLVAVLMEAEDDARRRYERSKGAGNTRGAVERLRREWIVAKGRLSAATGGR